MDRIDGMDLSVENLPLIVSVEAIRRWGSFVVGFGLRCGDGSDIGVFGV